MRHRATRLSVPGNAPLALDKRAFMGYIIVMLNDKPTYTLWNGSHMVATYPHTREGMDAAMVRAHGLLGTGTLTLYSSRDDLVWSSSDEDELTSEQLVEMDTIYDECGDYDLCG